MSIIRRSDCVPLPIVVCSVVAVVMLESRVARCVQCVENVACPRQATFYMKMLRLSALRTGRLYPAASDVFV